jgi:hypothetical protein
MKETVEMFVLFCGADQLHGIWMSGIFDMSGAELLLFKNEIADGFYETVCKFIDGFIETVCKFTNGFIKTV